jgi:pre-60S factor REI1
MEPSSPLFTCLSCEIAFPSADMQRDHYRSDHHRYNMKRRVASLPPVSAHTFDQKVLDRRVQTAAAAPSTGASCQICNKSYASENAYRSHFNSNKHKENEQKMLKVKQEPVTTAAETESSPLVPSSQQAASPAASPSEKGDAQDLETGDINARIAASRNPLSSQQCLFCSLSSGSLEENLTHMSTTHSFFVPDADYLVDINGLIQYLGEKVVIRNVCLFCNFNSREFRTLHAVRKHMIDKCHCKLAYDTEIDRLELSDYYDFTNSHPTVVSKAYAAIRSEGSDDWEDVSTDEEDEENVDRTARDIGGSEKFSDDITSEAADVINEVTAYGDSQFELVLPSGARIGHRSLRRYYAQSFRRLPQRRQEDPHSGAALVRQLLEDKNSALIPSRGGGFGPNGHGTEVIKARNAGEAQEAGRHVRQFRDQRRREDFKTRVGFRNNHQKHFRDPLLQ